MTKRRDRGDGGIDERGPNNYRLRYRIKGQRFSVTFRGTLQEARKKLRALLRSGDTGEHVAPDKITVGAWIEQWLSIGAPGRQRKRVGRRSLERYGELVRCHVVPTLGTRPLQQLQATEIDALYTRLEDKVSPRTARHVHDVFKSCLGTAVRSGLLQNNPMARVMKVPSPGEADHGIALDPDQLRVLVEGFRGSTLYPIVCVAAFTAPAAMKSWRCAGPISTRKQRRCASSGPSKAFTASSSLSRVRRPNAASARLPSMTIWSVSWSPIVTSICASRPASLMASPSIWAS
jgi:integrase